MTTEMVEVTRCDHCGCIVEAGTRLDDWLQGEGNRDFCCEQCSEAWYDEHGDD